MQKVQSLMEVKLHHQPTLTLAVTQRAAGFADGSWGIFSCAEVLFYSLHLVSRLRVVARLPQGTASRPLLKAVGEQRRQRQWVYLSRETSHDSIWF